MKRTISFLASKAATDTSNRAKFVIVGGDFNHALNDSVRLELAQAGIEEVPPEPAMFTGTIGRYHGMRIRRPKTLGLSPARGPAAPLSEPAQVDAERAAWNKAVNAKRRAKGKR